MKKIIEGNKIIAEFMGYKNRNGYFIISEHERYVKNDDGDIYLDSWFADSKLLYYYSWDWLMPVITKCTKEGIWQSDWTNQLHDGLLEQNIESCWEACIEFIKVYNG